MKKFSLILFSVLLVCFASQAYAAPIFFDDFESDLSAWIGKFGGHHGEIVDDPLQTDHALSFTQLNSGGDIFTTANPFSAGDYILTFDYLGLTNMGGTQDNIGGFIGISQGLPGSHIWLAGTSFSSGGGNSLIDDGQWHSYQISFTANYDFHLMLEDFAGSGGVAGDALFDNVRLDSPAIPEPATMFLLGTGIAGLAVLRRKYKGKSKS